MSKLGYFSVVIAAVLLFNSCVNKQSPIVSRPVSRPAASFGENPEFKQAYGAYVAGRVAHLRKDFNTAADYYMQALQTAPKNPELVSRIYLILTSQGRIAEAAKYAAESKKLGDKNNFINIIIAVDQMKKGQYQDMIKTVNQVDGIIYRDFINPLLTSWAYAGAGEKNKAIAALEPIKKEPSFKALYNFHAGMIYDYFDDMPKAKQHYEVIVNEESLEMSFRALQVICNFYMRNGQKDKAIALISKYTDERALSDMMRRLKHKLSQENPKKAKKIINNANIGTSEALFSIAATLRQGPAGVDLAHMFISLSVYENPNYDLAKLLLADILESREMYADANKEYDGINNSSEAYYTAQLKKANNLVAMRDYKAAELLMKTLTLDSKNYQLYLDLGDVLRMSGNQKEAIHYYKEAIDNLSQVEDQHWVLFYALGISYEQNDDWEKAEKAFDRALDLSQNHYMVLNYLGYSWMKRGEHVNEAFGMLVDAYNQAPHDGNIADSLGWAFYRLGMYDNAVTFLEKASELEPANAVISDHLGDAYWLAGRRNEGRFQWKHALTMKDPNNELNKDAVKAKIQTGEVENESLSFDSDIIKEKIELITTED